MSQIKAREPQADGPGGYADESALVAGLRAGRPEAYEALHAAYATSIYNLALRIVDDPHEAQDVTQEVVIKVLRGLPRDDGEFTLPAWLYRVTANAAFDHLRARKRRPVTVAADGAPELACEVDEYERAELSRRVETTLKELPKRQQVALVLRDVHGLSVGETASVLGVTRGSADVLLSRARSGFRKVFLAGTAGGRCEEAERILAGSVGGGVSAADRTLLEEHTRTCPDCGRTVALWGAAPVGLGLLLPQVSLPATLSFGATLAAAQAAGVALPAGLGAAAAAGASAAGATGAAAAASATAATSAAVPAATAAGGAGVLAALGSAAGVKIATLAAVATAAVGIAGVATHERAQEQAGPGVTPAALDQGPGGAAGGVSAGEHGRARLLATAHHRDGAGGEGHGGAGGHAAGESGHQGQETKSGDGSGGHSAGRADGGAAGSAGAGGGGSTHDGSGSGDGSSHSGGTGAATGGSSGGGTGGSGGGTGGSGSDGGTDASHSGSGAGTGSGGGEGGDSGSHSGGD